MPCSSNGEPEKLPYVLRNDTQKYLNLGENNMPCDSGPSREDLDQKAKELTDLLEKSKRFDSVIRHNKINLQRINDLEIKGNKLKGMLCSLLTELSDRLEPINLEVILESASENGQSEIRIFWEDHKKEDLKRVTSLLDRTFSPHEINLLKNHFFDIKE